ncbi:MAG: cohesin domain-containing protein [Pedobacter sp.]
MTLYFRHLFSIVFILLLEASIAMGASVSVKASGNGVFILQGDHMDGVAGIDLNVNYDSSSLASPKVDQGRLVSGGAMFTANPNFGLNAIKISIIRTSAFSGTGPLAVIAFASHTGSGIITVSTSMIDSNGNTVLGGERTSATDFQTSTIDSKNFISTAGVPFNQPSSTSTTTATVSTGSQNITAAPVSSSTTSNPGTASISSDLPTKNDTKTNDTNGIPVAYAEPSTNRQIEPFVETKTVEPPAGKIPVSEPQKQVSPKSTSYKGVLENFRAYHGEKTLAILIALFNKKIAPTIRQEPVVAVSDGKTPVKIVAELKGVSDKSPNFALNGAKLVSLNMDDASIWIVETLPQANIMQASLTILTDKDIIEYPLTLVPPVDGISPAEKDFEIFLSDNGAATPKRDLNGDGKRDYLDDYFYTAHYLIMKGAAGKAKK